MIQEFSEKPVRVFVIWEPVLATDWSSPSTASLQRISDTRTEQFWDRGRLISHTMGEHDSHSVVWDSIAVYAAGALWQDRPPQSLYEGGPVVDVTQPARGALAEALKSR